MFIGLFFGCSKIQRLTDKVTNPSAREIYARNFEDENLDYLNWLNELEIARTNILEIELPAVITGQFDPNVNSAVAYTMELERGEELFVEVKASTDSSLVFLDIYPIRNDSIVATEPVKSADWSSKRLNYPIESSGRYKVLIQAGLSNEGAYSYKIYSQPTLTFPVAGKDNKAIQSFWGASRDGGRRSHEGLDIFSTRGTPVVAATDGYVSFTGERGLGGKQVWLRNGLFGYSLYYAHLDSISAVSGKRVKPGDTLGFVGNTGNARTTAPHLHFGIYARGGAINPLPFVKMQTVPEFEMAEIGTVGVTKQRQNQLRTGPKVSYEKIATLTQRDTLKILGKVDNWYHVKSSGNLEGFMHSSLLSFP